MSMTERKKQAIRQYFERITHSHDKARGQLQEELIKLNAQIAADRLELAEEKIERYAKRGMSYEQALNTVISQLEEQDAKRKLKEDERARERTELELEEAEKRAMLELEEEGNATD
jgi:hypothetical protein